MSQNPDRRVSRRPPNENRKDQDLASITDLSNMTRTIHNGYDNLGLCDQVKDAAFIS